MAICESCSGVIGRDCFNPEECAWISHQQEMERLRDLEVSSYKSDIIKSEIFKVISDFKDKGYDDILDRLFQITSI